MIVSRAYEASELGSEFFQSIDVMVFGTVTDEERNTQIVNLFSGTPKPNSYHLDYDISTEEYSFIQTIPGLVPAQDIRDTSKSDMVKFFRAELNELSLTGKSILIDITGISQPAFFFLLKVLREDNRPQKTFFGYTEPQRYKAKELPFSEDVFLLTDRFLGLQALPGFLKSGRKRKRVLVMLIGFEGKRPIAVCETLNIPNEDIRIILGLPGFKPGWQYLAYGSNQSMFESYGVHKYIYMAAANDPFETYNALLDISAEENSQGKDYELVVAPLGTKPHSLGAAIFCLHNPESSVLIYDFPIKARRYRSEGYRTTWIYNFTDFIINF